MSFSKRFILRTVLLPSATVLSLASATVLAQEVTPQESQNTAPAGSEVEEVVVTGIRQSLQSATEAKRESVAFGDSIYAEDIGKLPATNLAETLNRIPGVKLNRDINGEGVQISVRGLGPSFSKVLLNGSQIAVASDGGTNGGSANREVDLDFFPSELFTRLDVAKTPVASQLEGGIAGTVNLRNARPFDREGAHLTVIGQSQYTDANEEMSPRGAIVASNTWNDKFGVLVGVSGVKTKTRIDGFESVGWTDGDLSQLGVSDRPYGNGFFYAATMPNNVRNFTPGTALNAAALENLSGVSSDVLKNALIPRLGRNSYTIGDRSRVSGLISMEYRPTDNLKFALDTMYAESDRDYQRLNMNWYVRSSGGTAPGPTQTGGMVPIDLTVDGNGVVTDGTFANSSFFLENDIFDQSTEFYNINPNMEWQVADNVRVNAQLNYSKSDFFREQPQFDFQTAPQSGVEVYLRNGGSDQPVITTNVDLNDPNLGWQWYRVNVQNVKRKTETQGAHVDTIIGDDDSNFKVGVAYDKAERSIRAFDNSAAFQTAVCGNPCTGATGLVPTSAIGQYLRPMDTNNFGHLASGSVGYSRFIMTQLAALERATNYAYYRDTAPQAIGAVTGGATGDIDEETAGAYVEANRLFVVFDRDLRVNAGVRYFHTDQSVTSPVQTGAGIFDQTLDSSYDDFLPSFNAAFDATDRLKLRFSVSRSMTRADAGQILPGTTFSDTSGQVASVGNPELEPYYSTNFDLGGEFYTGGLGYIGVALFRKDVDGFTANSQTQVPFLSLGIPYEDLTQTQQNSMASRGGPNATVTLNKPVNLNKLTLEGAEITWVQPLDFITDGLGFSANGTRIKQSASGNLVATGIAPYSYNLQAFYENYGVSLSLNYVWNDESIAANAPQNNVQVPLRADARGQLDLSAGYTLPFLNDSMRVTLDALNLTNEPLRTQFGYDNSPYSVYYPGRQVLLGLRATF
ncbi:TonB-dependent receptor [Steroidobacter flavus]|uniref:TonB-dependent receptor n=1 Tax=Steroidobacter flavus TaxID=1842136 RepID=A0ABV8T3B3_9GAMM